MRKVWDRQPVFLEFLEVVLDLAIRLEVLEVLEQKVHPEHAPLNLPM
jgi:hypothetical protein